MTKWAKKKKKKMTTTMMSTTTTTTTMMATMTTKRILLCRLSMYLNVKYQSNERRRIGLYRIFILRTSCLGFIALLFWLVHLLACTLSVIFYSASTNAHSLHTVLFLFRLFVCWVCSVVSVLLLLLVFTSLFSSVFVPSLFAQPSAIGTVFFICTIHFPHWFDWKRREREREKFTHKHTHVGQWCTVLLDIWCRRVIPLKN